MSPARFHRQQPSHIKHLPFEEEDGKIICVEMVISVIAFGIAVGAILL